MKVANARGVVGPVRLWVVALLMTCLFAGCGGNGDLGGGDGTVRERERGRAADVAVLSQEYGSNVPFVFVDRQKGASRYTYRIQDQMYEEKELLGLCRTLVANDANLVVCVVPSPALTRDEIGLIEARLRETGIRRIRVIGHQRGA